MPERPLDEPTFRPPDDVRPPPSPMGDPDALPPDLVVGLRLARVLHLALVAGLVLYGVVVAVLHSQGSLPADPSLAEFAWILALALLVAAFVGSLVIGRVLMTRHRAGHGDPRQNLMQATILPAALLETTVLLTITLALLSGSTATLAVGGLGTLIFLGRLPTRRFAAQFVR